MSSSVKDSSSSAVDGRAAGLRIGAILLSVALVLPAGVQAQAVRFSGSLQLDRRLSLADSVGMVDSYNLFRPMIGVTVAGRVEAVLSMDYRFHDFSSVASSSDLEDPGLHFPAAATVWEAFVKLPSFLAGPLDLSVGKQRIHWGTADGLNPTDRFNAHDLSDITDFTARVPTWAMRAEYYLGDAWLLDFVWEPTAHGPLLPPGFETLLEDGNRAAPPGPVASWTWRFEPPAPELETSQYGLRLARSSGEADLSLSYFNGFDGMPAVRDLLFTEVGSPAASGEFDARVRSRLPRLRVVGADVAGEWRGIGFWGEGAIVFPEEVEAFLSVVPGDGDPEPWLAVAGRPYASWTVGGDYTARGGAYLNLQWAHGLFFERGEENLHDYLLARYERRLNRDAVTLALEAAAEVAEWSEVSKEWGYGFFPTVTYRPADNTEVSLGAFSVGGRGPSVFRRWSGADQVYARVRVEF